MCVWVGGSGETWSNGKIMCPHGSKEYGVLNKKLYPRYLDKVFFCE
jgi:hypothetical protein